MAFRFVAILSVLAMASAGILPGDHRFGLEQHHQSGHVVVSHHGNAHHELASALHSGHGLRHHEDAHHDEHHGPAQYQFAYGVKDAHTGDIKEQEEKRDGDHVSGHYSLVEADGTRRVVHYQDNGHGFEAQVQREGHAVHQEAHHQAAHHQLAHHDAHHVVLNAGHNHEALGHHASSFQNVNNHHAVHHDAHHGHHY